MAVAFAVFLVLLLGAVAVVVAGHGDPMVEEYDDRPDVRVPAEGPLTSADLRAVRFTTALRGYRASEVDALLARLARELEPTATPADEAAPGDSARLARELEPPATPADEAAPGDSAP